MQRALKKFKPKKVKAIKKGDPDQRYNPKPPTGGLVLRVRAKILSGYEPTENKWKKIFQSSISRDNLWLTQKEHSQLVKGEFPEKLAQRLARFHLVDNTRGEPPMWRKKEIKNIKIDLKKGRLTGKAHLETEKKNRGYQADLLGVVETKGGKVTRLDIVAKGLFWGEGTYTRNAPKGKFPLVVSFELADGKDVADAVPPQGSRGWVPGYLNN